MFGKQMWRESYGVTDGLDSITPTIWAVGGHDCAPTTRSDGQCHTRALLGAAHAVDDAMASAAVQQSSPDIRR
eukprot:7404694-Pyramimonas_sp.AAC.1